MYNYLEKKKNNKSDLPSGKKFAFFSLPPSLHSYPSTIFSSSSAKLKIKRGEPFNRAPHRYYSTLQSAPYINAHANDFDQPLNPALPLLLFRHKILPHAPPIQDIPHFLNHYVGGGGICLEIHDAVYFIITIRKVRGDKRRAKTLNATRKPSQKRLPAPRIHGLVQGYRQHSLPS